MYEHIDYDPSHEKDGRVFVFETKLARRTRVCCSCVRVQQTMRRFAVSKKTSRTADEKQKKKKSRAARVARLDGGFEVRDHLSSRARAFHHALQQFHVTHLLHGLAQALR